MPLSVDILRASYDGTQTSLGRFYIGRVSDNKSGVPANIHYSVSKAIWPWESLTEFTHFSGNGALACVIEALGYVPSDLLQTQIPDEPVRVVIGMAGYYGVDRIITDFYINTDGNETPDFGIYNDIWPWEATHTFTCTQEKNLVKCITRALKTIEGAKDDGQGNFEAEECTEE